MKLRISKDAASDLEEIWLYTAGRWSIALSDRLHADFRTKFALLLRYPELGRRRDDLAPGFRGLSVENFIIFYRVHEMILEVVRVVHGARNIKTLFGE